MDSDLQSSRDAQPISVIVGIIAEDPSRGELLRPAINDQGWDAVMVDPVAPGSPGDEEFSLLVFSLSHVSPGDLEMIANASIQKRSKVLVIANDRNPQVIADALRSGADDYLISPFEPAEFVARMRSLVTRVWPSTDRRNSNGIRFDAEKRSIKAGPYAVKFTPLEWDVLSVLLEQDGVPVDADALAADLHLREVQPSTIPTIISRIRRKLAAHDFAAISVTTVQNRGYVAQFRRSSDQRKATRHDANLNRGGKRRWGATPASESGTQRLKSSF